MAQRGVSMFPPINPDHPLAKGAREVNDYATVIGLEATLDEIGMDINVGELAYLCEQRAYRAVAAVNGIDLGSPDVDSEAMVRQIVASPEWPANQALLIGAYMDGIAIGWAGREISRQERASK